MKRTEEAVKKNQIRCNTLKLVRKMNLTTQKFITLSSCQNLCLIMSKFDFTNLVEIMLKHKMAKSRNRILLERISLDYIGPVQNKRKHVQKKKFPFNYVNRKYV